MLSGYSVDNTSAEYEQNITTFFLGFLRVKNLLSNSSAISSASDFHISGNWQSLVSKNSHHAKSNGLSGFVGDLISLRTILI